MMSVDSLSKVKQEKGLALSQRRMVKSTVKSKYDGEIDIHQKIIKKMNL
jgi:hypothetical protein